MKKEIYEAPECVQLDLNICSPILAGSTAEPEAYSEEETLGWIIGENY